MPKFYRKKQQHIKKTTASKPSAMIMHIPRNTCYKMPEGFPSGSLDLNILALKHMRLHKINPVFMKQIFEINRKINRRHRFNLNLHKTYPVVLEKKKHYSQVPKSS